MLASLVLYVEGSINAEMSETLCTSPVRETYASRDGSRSGVRPYKGKRESGRSVWEDAKERRYSDSYFFSLL
jgi:hypothetical protein